MRSGSHSHSRATPRSRASGQISWRISSSSGASGSFTMRRSMRPASILARSTMSSINPSRWRPLPWIVAPRSRARSSLSGPNIGSETSSAATRIEWSGVRSSCDTVPRKSDFASLARRRSVLARSSSSTRASVRALIRAFSRTTAAWAASAVATPSSSASNSALVPLVPRVQPGDEPALEHDRHGDEGGDDRVPGRNADGCRMARDLPDSHRARVRPGEAQQAVPHGHAADRGRRWPHRPPRTGDRRTRTRPRTGHRSRRTPRPADPGRRRAPPAARSPARGPR